MIYPFNFSFSLSLLFMGFLLSNIFGILGSSKNIVFLFILCIELTNYFVYTSFTRKTLLKEEFKYENLPKPFKNIKITNVSFISTFLARFKKLTQIIFYGAADKKIIGNKDLKNVFTITIVLNFFKIGFEFGFFIDAFKLGS